MTDYELKALKYAETVGIVEYKVNDKYMEYWTFYYDGFYFVRYDLDKEVEVFRGAHIPFNNNIIPAFLTTKVGGHTAALYNYMIG